MHKATAIFLAGFLLLTGCSKQAATPAEPSTRDLFAMDTYMNLKVWSPDGEAILERAADRIDALECAFSVTLSDSDISRVNAAHGVPTQVSADTAAVLAKALEIGQESDGALDISVYPVTRAWGFTTHTQQIPDANELSELLKNVDYSRIFLDGETVTVPDGMEIDIGALAKGYTSDALVAMFRDAGVQSAIVSLGGNVQALGTKPDGSDWKVGIVDPIDPTRNMCVLQIHDKAVITSGNYERYFEENGVRYHHIMDSADGYPADNGLISVTVVGDSGLDCDALSTALFVEGTEKAIEHWKRAGDFEMVLVAEDTHTHILYTEGLADSFELLADNYPAEVISRE